QVAQGHVAGVERLDRYLCGRYEATRGVPDSGGIRNQPEAWSSLSAKIEGCVSMRMTVEVFATPGCSKCAQSREALQAVVESFGQDKVTWREVNIVDEIEYAVDLGIVVPPSIAIDGELVFPTLPTANKL